MNASSRRCGALAAAALFATFATSALACACCTHTGWRYVEVEKTSDRRLADVERMTFAKTAKLSAGEADPEIKGIANPDTEYQLAVARQKDRMIFSFRDRKGRAGNLVLAIPRTISIFEVDPRGGEKDKGLGPSLYKEWKPTADAAGDGLFRRVVGAGQKLTLVLHGRGIGCTDAGHFTDWTLLIHGPADKLTLYGALDSAGR
jgi:hypothetical protein